MSCAGRCCAASWCRPAGLTAGPVPNTGAANVSFSSNFTAAADRFYLNVHGERVSSVYGWSKGYFALAAATPVVPTAEAAAAAMA